MRKSLLTTMTLACGGASPKGALNAPARSAQSRVRVTSALRTPPRAAGAGRAPPGPAAVSGMIGRKGGAELELGDDLGVERLSQCHALVPALDAARYPAHEDDRLLRGLEQAGGGPHQLGRGGGDGRRLEAFDLDRRQRLGEL